MPARRFNEGDIDLEAIDADLAKLAAPKLSLRDVLDRLRNRLLEQRFKGRDRGADAGGAEYAWR